MIVKILPVQIPVFWENIKFCLAQVDDIDKDLRQSYFNTLLQSLLSDKSQCFIRLDDKRMLVALLITQHYIDQIADKNVLDIRCLYSYQKVSDNQWKDEYEFIKKFAKKLKCNSIVFSTNNKQVMHIGTFLGFVEQKKTFKFDLGVTHGQ